MPQMEKVREKEMDMDRETREEGVRQTHLNEGAARAGQDPPVQAGRQRSSRQARVGQRQTD